MRRKWKVEGLVGLRGVGEDEVGDESLAAAAVLVSSRARTLATNVPKHSQAAMVTSFLPSQEFVLITNFEN